MDEFEKGEAIANRFLDISREASDWIKNNIDNKDTQGTSLTVVLGSFVGLAQVLLVSQDTNSIHRVAALSAACVGLIMD